MYSCKNISDSDKAKTKVVFLSFLLSSYFFAPPLRVFACVFRGTVG